MRVLLLSALLSLGCNAITDFDRFHPAGDGGRMDGGPDGPDTGPRDAGDTPDSGGLVCGLDTADCDGDGVDCETDLSQAATCGACGTACGVPTSVCGGLPGARMCVSMCRSDQTMCGDTCVDIESDPLHCGRCEMVCPAPPGATPTCTSRICGTTCDTGMADCDTMPMNGCETDVRISEVHCGGCRSSCAAGQLCLDGSCGFGDGSDGVLEPMGTVDVGIVRAAANGTMGSRNLGTTMAVGEFADGDLVLVHQTRAPGTDDVGHHEYARITMAVPGMLTLEAPLAETYTTDATPDGPRAQVVRVEERTSITVIGGSVVRAPAWNGNHGGILAIDVRGDVVVAGTVDMRARGFRGDSHSCPANCDPMAPMAAPGRAGESHRRPANDILAPNTTGGSGAQRGNNNGGGGGGHSTAGMMGVHSGAAPCGTASRAGDGGFPDGLPNLRLQLLFGGAGGEGGRSDDATGEAGRGGNGGGAILIRARNIDVTGAIDADGEVGETSCATCCGGAVSTTNGPGGGGAGGAILLIATTRADIGASAVHARGGEGGRSSAGTILGGRGGDGYVTVGAPMVIGTSAPAYTP